MPSREADTVRRAFERTLLMAPLPGELERSRRNERALVKRLECVYDHARDLFKAALENRVEVGDTLRLRDGRAFKVDAVQPALVDGEAVFLEIKASPLAT